MVCFRPAFLFQAVSVTPFLLATAPLLVALWQAAAYRLMYPIRRGWD
jgi:hypothetical protein